MAQYRREQRTQELFRRRQSQNSELQSQSSSSSLAVDRKGLSSPSASQASASPAKRGRGKPPAAVKAVGGSDGKSGGTGKKTVSMASSGASGRPLSRRARRFDKVRAKALCCIEYDSNATGVVLMLLLFVLRTR
jgi:uncharacterized protein with LGFP repeats